MSCKHGNPAMHCGWCENEADLTRACTALERIEVKAQAGLCYFTLESAREFLKDIRDEVADALKKERPHR